MRACGVKPRYVADSCAELLDGADAPVLQCAYSFTKPPCLQATFISGCNSHLSSARACYDKLFACVLARQDVYVLKVSPKRVAPHLLQSHGVAPWGEYVRPFELAGGGGCLGLDKVRLGSWPVFTAAAGRTGTSARRVAGRSRYLRARCKQIVHCAQLQHSRIAFCTRRRYVVCRRLALRASCRALL